MSFDLTQTTPAQEEELEESSSLPLIRVLQDNSPQVNSRKEEYIEGAKAGMFLFNATKEVMEGPLEIVPVGQKACYVEWKPKTAGGGIVAHHDLTIINDPLYEKGRDKSKPYLEYLGENDLVRTSYWCILVNIGGEWQNAILAMTSSQLRVARKWSQQIRTFKYDGKLKDIAPPMFARKWELTTRLEKNASGDEYFNFVIANPSVLDTTKDEALLTQAFEGSKTAKAELPSPTEPLALAEKTSDDEQGEERPF